MRISGFCEYVDSVGIPTSFSVGMGWIWGLKSNPAAALLSNLCVLRRMIDRHIVNALLTAVWSGRNQQQSDVDSAWTECIQREWGTSCLTFIRSLIKVVIFQLETCRVWIVFSITILEPFCLELHIYRDRQRLRIASKKNRCLVYGCQESGIWPDRPVFWCKVWLTITQNRTGESPVFYFAFILTSFK